MALLVDICLLDVRQDGLPHQQVLLVVTFLHMQAAVTKARCVDLVDRDPWLPHNLVYYSVHQETFISLIDIGGPYVL